MIRAHFDAVVALLAPLKAAPSNTPILVGGADSIDQAPVLPAARVTPYVVVRPDSMPQESDRLAPFSGNLNGRIYVTCIGADVREVQWAQERTRALLVDKRPSVTVASVARSVAPLSLEGGSPVAIDRDVTPHLYYAVDVYRLFSA